MHVPFFDLRVTDGEYKKKLLDACGRVLDHGRLMLGPEVDAFEARVAQDNGIKYAVGVASGSSALYIALRSLGIGPGDEVITTPHTWIITLNAIAECGAIPVCVDIGDDFNIDPAAIENAISPATKAIVPMHYCGRLCDMEKICEIAARHQLHVVEDAAQAYGGALKGRKSGSFSTVASYSMNSMKVLASFGEAGAVVTNDEEIARKVRMFRYAGTTSDPRKLVTNDCRHVSLNHKLHTIQAAMLLVAMDHLPQKTNRRREIARYYNDRLGGCVITPDLGGDGDVHALYAYTIQAEDRDALEVFLREKQVETKIYHLPMAIDAPVYQNLPKHEIPNARRLVRKCLSIAAHEKLGDVQVEYVADKILEFYKTK
jgi:dTDP-4-amino-4,6-dideoxygalactose transaminase